MVKMIFDRFSLKGKVAIVTGAGRGIGKGIALAFAEAGADLVCVARTVSQIEAIAAEVRSLGRKALAIRCDVRDGKQVEDMVRLARQEFGHIDILVNNAAEGTFTAAMEMSESGFEADLRASLTSVFVCSKAVAKLMLKQKTGSIINISSRESQMPSLGLACLWGSKSGGKLHHPDHGLGTGSLRSGKCYSAGLHLDRRQCRKAWATERHDCGCYSAEAHGHD